MSKRAKCPKCHRDTWSEKWKACSSCGASDYQFGATAKAALAAQARADAAGDKRQQKRRVRLKKAIDRVPRFKPTDAFREGAAKAVEEAAHSVHDQLNPKDDAFQKRVHAALFAPTAEEVREQDEHDWTAPDKPLPGETCPTCNRKVPKRRKND